MGIMVGKAASDGSRPMHLWGKLSREVKVGETSKGEPKVQFGVCYSRGEFMNILAVGNDETTRVACALEKGDVVSIDGVWSQRKYRTRDGEEKSGLSFVPTRSHPKAFWRRCWTCCPHPAPPLNRSPAKRNFMQRNAPRRRKTAENCHGSSRSRKTLNMTTCRRFRRTDYGKRREMDKDHNRYF